MSHRDEVMGSLAVVRNLGGKGGPLNFILDPLLHHVQPQNSLVRASPVTLCTSLNTLHTSHTTHHTPHITESSLITLHTSHITHHTPHITQSSLITLHISHITHHTPHITLYTLHTGHSLSEEQFLCRLPAAVVRGGRLVNIRSEISATLHGSSSPLPDRLTSSTLQISPQTPLQNRLTRLEASFSPISRGSISPEIKMPLTDRLTSSTLRGTISPQLSLPDRPTTNPVSAPSSTTLKIRSESGDDMYIILRMRSHDTIADIWSRLIKKTPPTASATTHQLVMAVTRQVYSDLSASLLDCGLTHNATLHITKTTNSHHSNHVTVTDSNAVRKYHN